MQIIDVCLIKNKKKEEEKKQIEKKRKKKINKPNKFKLQWKKQCDQYQVEASERKQQIDINISSLLIFCR